MEAVKLHLTLGVDKLECVQKRASAVIFLEVLMTREQPSQEQETLSLEHKEDSGHIHCFYLPKDCHRKKGSGSFCKVPGERRRDKKLKF